MQSRKDELHNFEGERSELMTERDAMRKRIGQLLKEHYFKKRYLFGE